MNWSMQGKQLSQVLDKDPALTECRIQIPKRLQLYGAAHDEIDAVAWLKWVFALGHHKEIPHQFQDVFLSQLLTLKAFSI
jgi:hypothetical protein